MVKETAHQDDLAEGLRKLSLLASDAGAAIELALCHGAVMCVAYRSSSVTNGSSENLGRLAFNSEGHGP